MAKLPMDPASRLARAKQMGFDTERVLYHGGPGSNPYLDGKGYIEAFKTGENGAVYATDKPSLAGDYAMGRYPDRAASYPIVTNMRNPLIIDRAKDPWEPTRQIAERARAEGHDGIILKNADDSISGMTDRGPSDVHMIFDPKNIRSVNAAFDPAKSDSSNLMASHLAPFLMGAGAAGAVGMAPDTAAAQTPAMAQMLRSGGGSESHPTLGPQRMMAGQWDMLARKRQAGVPLTPDEEQAERGGHAYKSQIGDPAARDAATTVGSMALPLKVAALELLAPSPAGAGASGRVKPSTNEELQAEFAAGEAQRAANPSLGQMLRSMFGTVRQ